MRLCARCLYLVGLRLRGRVLAVLQEEQLQPALALRLVPEAPPLPGRVVRAAALTVAWASRVALSLSEVAAVHPHVAVARPLRAARSHLRLRLRPSVGGSRVAPATVVPTVDEPSSVPAVPGPRARPWLLWHGLCRPWRI